MLYCNQKDCEVTSMKTLKWLRVSIALQIVFCISCIVGTICMILLAHYPYNILSFIACILFPLWELNPSAWIILFYGLTLFLIERKDPEKRKQIGKRWLWFIVFFLFDTVMWLCAGYLLVTYMGGV